MKNRIVGHLPNYTYVYYIGFSSRFDKIKNMWDGLACSFGKVNEERIRMFTYKDDELQGVLIAFNY